MVCTVKEFDDYENINILNLKNLIKLDSDDDLPLNKQFKVSNNDSSC